MPMHSTGTDKTIKENIIHKHIDEAFDEIKDKKEKKPSKEEQKLQRNKERVIEEHVRLFDVSENKKFDDGLSMYIYTDDDDEYHIAEHKRFLKENKLTMRGKQRIQNHIKKPEVKMSKKEKLSFVARQDS